MDILARIQSGTQTAADEKFWKENIVNLTPEQKQKVVGELNFFGQYSHSTHVSGIIASVSPDARMISNRIFPDTPLQFVSPLAKTESKKGALDLVYRLLAMVTNGSFEKVAQYTNEQKIDVANYSLGTQLSMLAGMSLSLRKVVPPAADVIAAEVAKRCPPLQNGTADKNCATVVTAEIMKPYNDLLAAEVKRMYAQFEPAGRKWLKMAPNTLFVIAAGNDGANNDVFPMFPSNIRADNAISVAASLGVSALATFSNYGQTTVDVAAPGVAIKSSVPSVNNKMILPMSGTSMAAPFVAGVAAKMKDINPKLTPAQMRTILMGTVDKKDWLKTKVISSGIVNPERAYLASEKSKIMTVAMAIEGSLQGVEDQKEANGPKRLFRANAVTRDMQDMAKKIVF